jgi:PAS domain S-box-containing protein
MNVRPGAGPPEDTGPQLLASIVESSDDAIISKDLNGVITTWNKGAERIFGYTAEEAIGKPVTMLIPEALQAEEPVILERIRQGDRIDHYETVRRRKDGTEIDISLTVSPVTNGAGEIVGASKIARDISERKRASEAVRRADKHFRDFVENASVGMHWIGPDGIIIWANRSELEMLGYTEQEYIGRHIAEFHVEQPVIEDILRRLNNRETLKNYEAQLRCKDGSIREVMINSNVYWEGEKFVHTRCFTRDVSERKQYEQRIEILGREAEHRAKNIMATVQAIVHLTHAGEGGAVKQAIAGRIQALANVHTLFAQSRWAGAELSTLIDQELAPYSREGSRSFRTNGPKLLLKPETAQTMAVVLHELATNAAKHGALSATGGSVGVEWSLAPERQLVVRWTEMGGPMVQPPSHEGFGTRVVEKMVSGQLGGKLEFRWRPEGMTCEITLPNVDAM